MPNIMTIPGFVRGFIGQGICYPTTFSTALAGLACFTLDEVVDKELNLGKAYGFDFPQKVLTPGRQYRLENGTIETGRKECPIGKLTLLSGRTPLSCPEIRKYAQSALSLDIRDFNAQKLKIEKLLDTIFLPYWFASSVANLRNAILSHADRAYRLQFIGQSGENCIYEFTFADS